MLLDVTLGTAAGSYHGKYQAVRRYVQVVEYVCKCSDYITTFQDIRKGKVMTFEETLNELFLSKGRVGALNEYYTEHLKKLFIYIEYRGQQAFQAS